MRCDRLSCATPMRLAWVPWGLCETPVTFSWDLEETMMSHETPRRLPFDTQSRDSHGTLTRRVWDYYSTKFWFLHEISWDYIRDFCRTLAGLSRDYILSWDFNETLTRRWLDFCETLMRPSGDLHETLVRIPRNFHDNSPVMRLVWETSSMRFVWDIDDTLLRHALDSRWDFGETLYCLENAVWDCHETRMGLSRRL